MHLDTQLPVASQMGSNLDTLVWEDMHCIHAVSELLQRQTLFNGLCYVNNYLHYIKSHMTYSVLLAGSSGQLGCDMLSRDEGPNLCVVSEDKKLYLVKSCFGKAGVGAAPVIRGKIFQRLVLASQKAAPYWAVGNNTNAKLPAYRDDIFLQKA